MRQRVTDAAAGAVSADEQIIGQLLRILTGCAQLQPPGRQVQLLAAACLRDDALSTMLQTTGKPLECNGQCSPVSVMPVNDCVVRMQGL